MFKNFLKNFNKKKIKKDDTENNNIDILKILIVDDAKINRYLLVKYIEKFLIERNKNNKLIIHEAINGNNSIEMYDEYFYDIIFMDYKMNGINGIEATKIIKSRNKNVKIFGISGQIEKEIVDKALNAGMNYFLGKPIEYHVIVELLTNYK